MLYLQLILFGLKKISLNFKMQDADDINNTNPLVPLTKKANHALGGINSYLSVGPSLQRVQISCLAENLWDKTKYRVSPEP